jgi:drug/metabolite transporter (DMT)-like permease
MFLNSNNNCYFTDAGTLGPIIRRAVMAAKTPVHLRLIAGIGGALLIASLFLPWADAAGIRQSGWQFNTVLAVYLVIVGVFGIATGITGGQYGIGRADVSLIGATDLLNTTGIVLLAWLVLDFPEHATRQAGVYGALVLVTITGLAVADYRPLRGAPWFAPVRTEAPARANIAE